MNRTKIEYLDLWGRPGNMTDNRGGLERLSARLEVRCPGRPYRRCILRTRERHQGFARESLVRREGTWVWESGQPASN